MSQLSWIARDQLPCITKKLTRNPGIFIKKSPKQTQISLIDCLLKHTPYLEINPNDTERQFETLILEEELDIMYGTSTKTTCKIMYF